MIQIGQTRPHWRRAVPPLILAIGTGLSLFVFYEATITDDARVRSVLELRAEWRASDFDSKISDAAVPVEALAISIAAHPNSGGAEFHHLALQARGDDPIAGLAWWPRVTRAERAVFERAARADVPDFAIRDTNPAGGLELAGDRDEYFPMRFEERFGNLPSMSGYDLESDSVRQAAASRARDAGTAIATAVLPPRGDETTPRYDVVWPIYRDAAPTSIEERRAKLIGFVSGTYNVDAIFNFAIRNTPVITESLSLFIDQPRDTSFGTPTAKYLPTARKVVIGSMPIGEADKNGLRLVRSLSKFGVNWVLVFDNPPEELANLSSATRWGYLLFGMALTLLIALNEMMQQRQRIACEALVVERTRDLRRTGEQLNAIIEASPFAISCVDPKGCVTLWNRTAEQIFGYQAKEAIGQFYPVVPAEDLDAFKLRLASIATGEIVRDAETLALRKDGAPIEVRFSAAPFYDSTRELVGIIFAVEDTTERNKVLGQLIAAQKMETVGQLTGGLAHDFNNILGAVIGNLDLADEQVARGSKAAGYFKAALDAALSAAELVKRLLAFSRRQPLRPERIDLASVIGNVMPLLTRTLGEHIQIATTQTPDCWPAVADAVQLESAILNLAINARDAMPGGGVLTIDAANVNVDEAFASEAGNLAVGDYATVSVTDTGVGMSPEVLSHVFEPFYTTKPPGEGSGLGLSMVFGTMTQMGGSVRIYSEVGVGTTVRLFLPRAAAAGQRTDSAPPVETGPISTGNEHILMVEDNAQIREVGASILRNLGYQVTLAESGDEAMHQIENDIHFDLLFSDIVMAGRLNGLALAAELRKRDSTIPILLTSGFTSPGIMRDGVSDLGAELILKPYRRVDLAQVVRNLLDKGARGN